MSPLPTVEGYDFCSVYSRDVPEPLRATATRADVWMLLEYLGRWGARAFPESDLADAVKAHVTTFQETTPNTRIQFIRKPGRYEPDPIHFYVAVANDSPPRLYAFEFQQYEDLLEVDLTAIVAGKPEYDAHRQDGKLFLVCVNGLRDACCAKFGLPVQAAVAETAGEQAWQSTHIGGHRLAPNLLFLPHGLSYGRGTPEAAERLVESYRQDEIYLPHFRGRTTYDRPQQAAEHFLRERTGEMGIDAYRVMRVEELGDGQWEVVLEGAEDGRQHLIQVEARPLDQPVYKTCSATEPSVVEHYYLTGYETAQTAQD
ncbi:MAG: hypothetical protein M3220_08415 [Chloroflexota bacterium]|nr:hypothetical protein [Chloroflexota bacterium]